MRLTYRKIVGRDGKFLPWLDALSNKSGVYVIASKRGRILYVGESHTRALRKTVTRHFWRWKDSVERKHHCYDPQAVKVAVVAIDSRSAVKRQNDLIHGLKPRDNLLIPVEEKNPF